MDEKDFSFSEEDEIITLQNEKNEDVDFYHVATIDYKDNWYIFLEPVEEIEDIGEDEVLIFRLEEGENGQDNIVPIDSEEELQGVYNEYLAEMENIDSCSHDKNCKCKGDGDGINCDCKGESKSKNCDCKGESEGKNCDCKNSSATKKGGCKKKANDSGKSESDKTKNSACSKNPSRTEKRVGKEKK